MRRTLACLMTLGLLLGGAAACGDDDGGGDSAADTTTTTEAREEVPPSDSGNEAVDDFCDTVQELIDAIAEVKTDPFKPNLQQELNDLVNGVTSKGSELSKNAADLTPEETEHFEACRDKLEELNSGS